MPARPHFNFPGIPQIIHKSTKHQQPCFFVDKDYLHYLEILQSCSDEYQCHIHAYALMPDSIYLLATTHSSNGLANMMQLSSSRYVSYVQKTYAITDSLWDGGYKSCLLECESYLLSCMSYVEQAPARINITAKKGLSEFEEYRWSSYLYNATKQADSVITPHSIYLELSRDEQSRLKAYKELLKTPLAEKIVSEINEALNNGAVLGSQTFKDKIKEHLSGATGKSDDECFDCVMFY